MNILITGSNGFIGKNLIIRLKQEKNFRLFTHDIDDSADNLIESLNKADLVYHLAGINRPENPEDFYNGNSDLTRLIVDTLISKGGGTPVIFSSSIHAEKNNDYGISKRLAENSLFGYIRSGGRAYIYRLFNVFGKWCRPNYNSVVATFCHNIAVGLPVQINDPGAVIKLNYIDDIVEEFMQYANGPCSDLQMNANPLYVSPSYSISLSELAGKLEDFRNIRETRILPDLSDVFEKKLYSVFLSYLPFENRRAVADLKTDERGNLFELVKSPFAGQIFVSKTKPGITRGNHYHHTKVEKFCVISGSAAIRLRKIGSSEIEEYSVSGENPELIDIPPGYTHNIENTGDTELITLFWANEIFDPEKADTYFEEV